MNPETAVILDWPAVAGSGFVVAVLFLALVERLRRTFATREEVNLVGDKFTALQSLYLQTREAADHARDRLATLASAAPGRAAQRAGPAG